MKLHSFIILSLLTILLSSCSNDAELDSVYYIDGDRPNIPTRRYHVSRSDIASCSNKLKMIGMALRVYGDDHNGSFVDEIGYKAFKVLGKDKKYLELKPDNPIYHSAGSFTSLAYSEEEFAERHTDYALITKGIRDNTWPASSTPIAFTKPGVLGDSFNVLFVDGHVETIKSRAPTCAEFIQALAQQRGVKLNETCLENAKALDKILFGEAEETD